MPTWAWVLTYILVAWVALLIVVAIALALIRFRYFIEWRGEWSNTLSGTSGGTARVETRFFWYKNVWEPLKDTSWSIADLFGDDDDADVAADAPSEGKSEEDVGGRKSTVDPEPAPRFSEAPARPSTQDYEEPVFLKSDAPGPRAPDQPRQAFEAPRDNKKKSDPNRKRRALFRLITDRAAWKLVGRYGVKIMRLVLRLLKPRIEAAVGHPDPAFLGRVAGKWYAIRPILPLGDANLYFRFQDRHPSLWIRIQGSFSALSVLGFGIRLVVAFPFILLARRGLHSWRRHALTGWRAWVYRKLQTSG